MAGPKALTGVGRYKVGPGTAPLPPNPLPSPAWRGWPRRAGCGGDPYRSRTDWTKKSPAGRKPSPTGKVDRAQPGPDEGKQPKSEKQATLNGSISHSMWPVSLLGYGPSSVTPNGVPPSPEGKASSGGGFLPAGAFPYLPLGEGADLRRKRGSTGLVLGTAPHPSGLRPATLSQERVFPLIRPGLRPVHLKRRGRLPPAEAFPYLSFGFSNIFSVYPFTNPLLCCKIDSSSQKLREVWS